MPLLVGEEGTVGGEGGSWGIREVLLAASEQGNRNLGPITHKLKSAHTLNEHGRRPARKSTAEPTT